MYIALTIFLCLFAITFHELGHAFAMWRSGVRIKTISLLGFRFPGLPYLSKKIHIPGQKEEVDIQINPIPLGAFVMPDADSLQAVDARTKGYIYGAGPFASLLYSLLLYMCMLATARMPWDTVQIVTGVVYLALLVIMLSFHKFICQYVIVILGACQAATIVWLVASNLHQAIADMGGPVTIAHLAAQDYHTGKVQHIQLTVLFYTPAWLSMAFGLTNAMPFSVLDGGRIAGAYLSKFNVGWNKTYTIVGSLLLVLLVLSACSNDFKLMFNGLMAHHAHK